MVTMSASAHRSAMSNDVHAFGISTRVARRVGLLVILADERDHSMPAARSAGTWTRSPKPVPTTTAPGTQYPSAGSTT